MSEEFVIFRIRSETLIEDVANQFNYFCNAIFDMFKINGILQLIELNKQ